MYINGSDIQIQTHRKLTSNALQTPPKPETCRFYIRLTKCELTLMSAKPPLGPCVLSAQNPSFWKRRRILCAQT